MTNENDAPKDDKASGSKPDAAAKPATDEARAGAAPTAGTAPTEATGGATTGSVPDARPTEGERVKFQVTGSVKGKADVFVGSTVAEALKLAGITQAPSSLNLRDSNGNPVKGGDKIAQSVTYTAKGGTGESRVSSSQKMNGG